MKTLFGILLAAVAVALAGCETESSDQIAISISPNNVTMEKGESREFTASGWRDYTWSLSDTSIGILSTTKGDSTVYTAVSGAPSNSSLTQVLSVTVNIASSTTGSSTNTTTVTGGNLVSAEALINVPSATISPPTTSDAITISPSVANIQKGQSVELKAVGPSDVTDYVWELKAPNYGTLSALGGSSTIFTATKGPATTLDEPFTQVVSLSSDGGKNTTTAAITISSFPSASDAIKISPSIANIQKGQSVELKAVGPSDVTDYVWKLKDPKYGTLSALGGSSTIFTATSGPATEDEVPFTQIVSLSSDGGKNTTTAAITISSFP